MEQLTGLGKAIVAADPDKIRLDMTVKNILAYEPEKHDTENTKSKMIRMLTDLFDERINGAEKIKKLKSEYELNITREVEMEVTGLCTYADAIENKGIAKGIEKGIEKGVTTEKERGLEALVKSLKIYIRDFEELYKAVIKNETYEKVSKDDVMKYFHEPLQSN